MAVEGSRDAAQRDANARLLIEANPNGVIVCVDGIVMLANEAAARMLGRASKALEGDAFSLPFELGARRDCRIERAHDVLTVTVHAVSTTWSGVPAILITLCAKESEDDDRVVLSRAVLKVVAGVSASTGTELFERLARKMTEALGAAGGVVARISPNDPLRARTVSAVLEGVSLENFEYTIEGMPCERLLGLDECVVLMGDEVQFNATSPFASMGARTYVGRRLTDSSENPLGFLYVVYREPIEQPDLVTAMLQIFAARAAAELERQDADAVIREQASLLDKAKDAIIVRDTGNRITFWNKGAERTYGYLQAEVLGRNIEELLYEDPTEFRAACERLGKLGEWSGEIAQRHKDGRTLTVEGHWTLVRDATGCPEAVLAINTDVTKRLAIEAQLQQSQRLESIGQLTGGVAHDFNNLLTVILGNAEVLSLDLPRDSEQRELAEMIRAAALRGGELTNRLLTFARRQALKPKAVSTDTLIDGMLGLLRRTLSEDIEVSITHGRDVPLALVDPSQLEDALLNLCINARDAMASGGGRLHLETSSELLDEAYAERHPGVVPGAYVRVAVTDTGSGIAPEHLTRIFDPFFTTKALGKGTGLGLSMVYGFVKQSHGHVQISSVLGHGATVEMFLPKAEGVASAPESVSQVAVDVSGTETILLVEDDALVRRHVEDQLRDLGYRVLSAANGPEALTLFGDSPDIDLIFTDVIMPGGMNGLALADAARLIRPSVKVLYTSGYSESVEASEQLSGRFLTKPYRKSELGVAVRTALSATND